MPATGSEGATIATLRPLVRAHSGLATTDDHALIRAASVRQRATGARSLASYARLVREDASGAEIHALVEEIRNGETYFFRDHGQMTLLRETLLPAIIERRRADRTIRIWSAGCSTGEEPYSIAMLIDELLPDRAAWSIHLLGTDIHRASLERAVEGLYGPNSFRSQAPMGAPARARHFHREERNSRLAPRIREMVSFETHNLARDPLGPQHSQMDLVVCRNVLIYFEAEAAQLAAEKLASALALGGHLLVGHTELHGRAPPGIHPVFHPESIVYERADHPAPLRVPRARAASWPAEQRPRRAPKPTRGALPAPLAPAAMPPPVDAREAAREAADLGLHAEATHHAHEALRADPDDVAMHHLLAHVAEELGDEDEARSRLRKVIYLDPRNIEAHLHLALLHEHAGDPTRARRLRANALTIASALPSETPIAGFEALTAGKLAQRLRSILEIQGDPGGPAHA